MLELIKEKITATLESVLTEGAEQNFDVILINPESSKKDKRRLRRRIRTIMDMHYRRIICFQCKITKRIFHLWLCG
jgi:hypothetical protein